MGIKVNFGLANTEVKSREGWRFFEFFSQKILPDLDFTNHSQVKI